MNKRKKKKAYKKYIKSKHLTQVTWAMLGRYVPNNAIASDSIYAYSNYFNGGNKYYYLFSFSSTRIPRTSKEKEYVSHYRNQYKPSNAFQSFLVEQNLYKAIQEKWIFK